jgi:hypothetical protein
MVRSQPRINISKRVNQPGLFITGQHQKFKKKGGGNNDNQKD